MSNPVFDSMQMPPTRKFTPTNNANSFSKTTSFCEMRAARSATLSRLRNPARYIAVRDRDQTFHFELSRTGSLITPPEFTEDRAAAPRSPDQCALSVCVEQPSKRSSHGFEFVGFLDSTKLETRTVGYSISDLLARPFVPMHQRFPPILA